MQAIDSYSNSKIDNFDQQKRQIKKNVRIVKEDFLAKVNLGMNERKAFEEAINTHLKKQIKTDQFEKEDFSNNENEKKFFVATKLCKGIKPGRLIDYLNAIDTVVSFADMVISLMKKDKNQ